MSDLGKGSEAVANYIAICNTVADSYPRSKAHGLQKDAIQNSLDARKGKSVSNSHYGLIFCDDVLSSHFCVVLRLVRML